MTFVPAVTDWATAFGIAAIAFAVFVRTMYPGIFGGGDATKFAFVGKVLGTPHAPGYPLYVMVSHLFSYVPWGTLAHRMNGLSALFGAIAAGLAYLAGRRLGLGPLASAAGALSLAFGRSFWAKAEYAKTYTLNATIVCAGLIVLLRWGASRRRRDLWLAIAIFALSLGNHLIVVSLLPALVIYALVVDWRLALSWRTLLFAAAAVAISLCQYLFILIRTLQHAPYLEASAHNLRELVNVITVRRWSQEIGAYAPAALLDVRVPTVGGLVLRELTIPGLVLAIAGLAVLAVRRWREALLCGAGALGVLALTANMSSNEDEGFLLPAFLLLWLLAAAGLDEVVRRALTLPAAGARRTATVAVTLAAAAMPLALLRANLHYNDHHERTYEIRYFDALFEMLPDRSTIVDDRYTINMMLRYKLLGEDAARGRRIDIIMPNHAAVERALAAGSQVFAFPDGQRALANFGYEFAEVQLLGPELPAWLPHVPRGSIVVFAGTPDVAPLLRPARDAWETIGVDSRALFGNVRSRAAAAIGVAGAAGAMTSAGLLEAAVSVPEGAAIAGTNRRAAVALQAGADLESAWITVDGVERVRTRGAAIAVIGRAGDVEAQALDPRTGLRVPLDMRPLPLGQLTASSICRDIGNLGWQDLSSLAAGGVFTLQIDNYRSFLSRTMLYVAAEEPPRPDLSEISGAGTPSLATRIFRPADRAALAAAAAADTVALPAAFTAAPFVARIEISVDDRGAQKGMRLRLGVHPTALLVRSIVDLDNPKRSTICFRSSAAR